ncbi:MAG: hypothetical protein GY765_43945 [bacterium]|nr:hypothetical protein [bacterium]
MEYKKNRGRLGVVDKKGQVVDSFFNETPIPVDIKEADPDSVLSYPKMLMLNTETRPIFAVDEKKENVLVTFKKPDNPIRFYLYNLKSKQLKNFSYEIPEKEYKLSDFYLKASLADIMDISKYPKEAHIPVVSTICFHKEHYIVTFFLVDYEKKDVIKSRSFFLVLDKNGKPIKRITVDPTFRLFSITPDGYVLSAKMDEDDEPKLCIYKLTL